MLDIADSILCSCIREIRDQLIEDRLGLRDGQLIFAHTSEIKHTISFMMSVGMLVRAKPSGTFVADELARVDVKSLIAGVCSGPRLGLSLCPLCWGIWCRCRRYRRYRCPNMPLSLYETET